MLTLNSQEKEGDGGGGGKESRQHASEAELSNLDPCFRINLLKRQKKKVRVTQSMCSGHMVSLGPLNASALTPDRRTETKLIFDLLICAMASDCKPPPPHISFRRRFIQSELLNNSLNKSDQ